MKVLAIVAIVVVLSLAGVELVLSPPWGLPDGWQGRCDPIWQGKWSCEIPR